MTCPNNAINCHVSAEDAVGKACEALEASGARLTRQRRLLAHLIFEPPFQHVSAETIARKAAAARASISLATIYNTLSTFVKLGLLRQIPICGDKVYYDTNASTHQHYFLEDRQELVDLPGSLVDMNAIAPVDGDYEVASVDVVVRLRRRGAPSHSERRRAGEERDAAQVEAHRP